MNNDLRAATDHHGPVSTSSDQTPGRPLAYLFDVPIDRVKGIGPQTGKKLTDAGIASVGQLLLHVPRRYLDRSQLFDLSSVPLGEEVTDHVSNDISV